MITSLEKLLEKSLGERYNACYRLFAICPRTSRTPKFRHTYVITYGDFKVNVEPCIRDVKTRRTRRTSSLYKLASASNYLYLQLS